MAAILAADIHPGVKRPSCSSGNGDGPEVRRQPRSYGGFGGPSHGGGFYGGGFYPRPPIRNTVFIGHGGVVNTIISIIIFIVVLVTAFGSRHQNHLQQNIPKAHRTGAMSQMQDMTTIALLIILAGLIM
ncbi:MAG: hypothetical protein ACLU71_13590 [Blautia hansenii]